MSDLYQDFNKDKLVLKMSNFADFVHLEDNLKNKMSYMTWTSKEDAVSKWCLFF